MATVFTHFGIQDGSVDLLAGAVTACTGCGRALFRDHAFISDGHQDTANEPTAPEAHLALGRRLLPDEAERVDEGATVCDECSFRDDELQ